MENIGMTDLSERFFQVQCADDQEVPQAAASVALPRCSVAMDTCADARGRLPRDTR